MSGSFLSKIRPAWPFSSCEPGVKMFTIVKKALGLALIIIGVLGILKEAFVIGGLATVFGSYLAGLDDLD